ncbi:hypothetical protein [Saccharothrix sp. Mg75]|uniref:hypothetical protein n=1 Tax=Saccharothrix sp. Mg75 TaxID=3445357 RepID=UPI003EEC805A
MSTVIQSITHTPETRTTATALEFGYDSDPSPVRVSPSTGNPELANLFIVGSRRSREAIECRKITLVIPTGTASPDLALDLEGIKARVSLEDWTPTPNPQQKTITFLPTSGHSTISKDEGITIELLDVRVNREVGVAPLRIETEHRVVGEQRWETDTVTLEIGKFPASFYLRNFIATPLLIDNGDDVRLTWEAGGYGTLRLLYDTSDCNMHGQASHTVAEVTNTTVFYLRATVQVGTGTAEHILSTTVSVRVPDLEVGDLYVYGRIGNLRSATRPAGGGLWTASNVPGLFGTQTPGLFRYGNQLHCAGTGFLTDDLRWITFIDGSWADVPIRLSLPVGAEPAFTEVRGRVCCVYRTPDDAMHVTYGERDGAQLSWSSPTRITAANWTTSHRPALTNENPNLVNCVFRRPDGSLYWGSVPTTGSWSAAEPIASGNKTTHAPDAAMWGLIPMCAYRTEDGSIYVHAVTISNPRPMPGARTSEKPALVMSPGLRCAYLDENTRLQLRTMSAISTWSPPVEISPLPATTSPSLAVLDDVLHATFR